MYYRHDFGRYFIYNSNNLCVIHSRASDRVALWDTVHHHSVSFHVVHIPCKTCCFWAGFNMTSTPTYHPFPQHPTPPPRLQDLFQGAGLISGPEK